MCKGSTIKLQNTINNEKGINERARNLVCTGGQYVQDARTPIYTCIRQLGCRTHAAWPGGLRTRDPSSMAWRLGFRGQGASRSVPLEATGRDFGTCPQLLPAADISWLGDGFLPVSTQCSLYMRLSLSEPPLFTRTPVTLERGSLPPPNKLIVT